MSKGMEALEIVKTAMLSSGNCLLNSLWDYTDVIEKELKALEIIKEKGLSTNDIAFIKNGDSWETYDETMKELCWGDEHLDKVLKTQEEFDLLKEVLWED